MTPQEIFDTAVCGVIRQGGPSVITDGACAYRGSNGRMCAVGFLLDDHDAYQMEGGVVGDFLNEEECLLQDLKSLTPLLPNADLLRDLQGAHDGSALVFDGHLRNARSDAEFLPLFLENARNVARRNGLSFDAAQAAYDEGGE